MFLLITAQMYSRLLAIGGAVNYIKASFLSLGVDPFMIIGLMVVIWILLGMLIDSVSIILLTVPIFAPIAAVLGIDPLAFAIFGILVIEAGLLNTPVRAAGLYRQGVGSRPDSDAVQNLHRIIPLFPVDFGGGLYRLIHSSVGQLVTSNHVAMTDETAVRFSLVTCPHHFCSSSPFGTGAGISCTKMNRT